MRGKGKEWSRWERKTRWLVAARPMRSWPELARGAGDDVLPKKKVDEGRR